MQLKAIAAAAADSTNYLEETNLPDELVVLRSKMLAYTALAGLRWDRLTRASAEVVRALIELHGDQALIKRAMNTTRAAEPPVFVQFYLRTWEAMPVPGSRLAVVDDRCAMRGHEYESAKSCRWCAAEAKTASA